MGFMIERLQCSKCGNFYNSDTPHGCNLNPFDSYKRVGQKLDLIIEMLGKVLAALEKG